MQDMASSPGALPFPVSPAPVPEPGRRLSRTLPVIGVTGEYCLLAGPGGARYRWDGSEVSRSLDPLGLILEARNWYLAARRNGADRTYRVSRILDVEELAESSQWPDRPSDLRISISRSTGGSGRNGSSGGFILRSRWCDFLRSARISYRSIRAAWARAAGVRRRT